MEDEEFVPENCDLRFYLETLKLSDTHKENPRKEKSFSWPLSKENNFNPAKNVEIIDKDVIEQIGILLSARMIFEEDLAHLEGLISKFKVVKVGMLRSIFENVSGFIVIFLGLCVYWVIGSYVFFMISLYYAYNAADYLWKKHFNQKRIMQLNEILMSNFILFKKTLKFIDDSDKILKSDNNILDNPLDIHSNCKSYVHLKEDFLAAEKEIISIMTTATKTLINKFPFYDYIENPHNYLFNKYDQYFSECIDIKKLYQIYLLVQSEFLQRLALSLIPNVKVSGKENTIELYKIIKDTSFLLKRLESRLRKKFKFVFLRGICDTTQGMSNLKFQRKTNSDVQSQYKNELLSSIQDISNSFQRLLIRSRAIEDNFSDDSCSEKMANELTNILNELNVCQRNISDSFIMLKKCFQQVNYKEKYFSNNINESSIETDSVIDLTTDNETIQDEVFEAYIENDFDGKNGVADDYDFEDHMKKKMEREYSRSVLEELKSKIAYRAKKLDNTKSENTENKSESKCVNIQSVHSNGLINKENCHNTKSSDCDAKYKNETEKLPNLSHDPTDICEDSDENSEKVSFFADSACDSSFLNSIFEARKKLLTVPLCEEHFCASDNDSDSDK